jgi:uncharacterized protein involved in exopolysaccharide biosynthesis/Mrp family chromosome partitioning ATPase
MLERTWPTNVIQSPQQQEREGGFTSLADIFAFVRGNLVPVGLFVALGLLLAQVYVVTTEPTYTASSEVLITPRLPASLQLQPSEINLSLDTAQIESQIVVLRSEKIAKLVIDQLDLVRDPNFTRTDTLASRLMILEHLIRQTLGIDQDNAKLWFGNDAAAAQPDSSPEAEFVRARRTMYTFMSNLDVHRVGVSYALEILFRSPNPELAASIANATADAYMREQLETRVTDAENGLQWLEDRIEHIRMQMNDAAIAAQTFRSRHDYTIGARTEASGGTPSDAGKAKAADGSEAKGVTLDELEATAESYKKMYESFLQAFTTSANQRPTADARVITVATSPLVPSGPRKKLILAFGAMSGIMLGVGLAFLRNMLDVSVRRPRQLRDGFGLDCLGELPTVPRRWGGFGRFDEVARAPDSAFGRAVKGVKAAVAIAALDRPIRFVGVTSVSPGEGKSTLAGNLAASWAMAGARVLLIDADAEHSVISRRIAHVDDPEKGGKGAEWQVGSDPKRAFDVLSSHAVERHDLLAAGNMQKTLSAFEAYEMVIVDLPPFTSGNHGLAAASQLDGVIVAIEWGKTSEDAVAELIHALLTAKAAMLGAVLTKVRKSSTARLRRRARQTPR